MVRIANEELAHSPPSGNGWRSWSPSWTRRRAGARLYDALETGEFGGGELAPRIKSLYWR